METGIGQVSSTSIRNALAQGRPKDAAKQLGHWHRIEGLVIGGEQRGGSLDILQLICLWMVFIYHI